MHPAASVEPIPLTFEPLFRERVWGGRALQTHFGKRLPANVAIGESWELSDLPEGQSRVRAGPCAGMTLAGLIAAWGRRLLGDAPLVSERFPLLIKLLDARETLSIQVHPRPREVGTQAARASATSAPVAHPLAQLDGGVKHEAWIVLDCQAGAELLIGLRPGVSRQDVIRAGPSAALVECLRRYPVRRGDCFYLPSGVPHALGAGVLVAEVQTPSDVTYRLYDWDRGDADGKRRALHWEEGVANLRDDAPVTEIAQRPTRSGHGATTLVRSPCFTIDRIRITPGATHTPPLGEMVAWLLTDGELRTRCVTTAAGAGGLEPHELSIRAGELVLLPADARGVRAESDSGADLLQVRIPTGANRE